MAYAVKKLAETFVNKERDGLLKDIYVDEQAITYQRNRYVEALEKFEACFGQAEVNVYSAPGRSEVGGNHTDHQHGKVIAASINLDAIAVVTRRDDQMVRIVSEGYEPFEVDLTDLAVNPAEEGTSIALTRGVAAGVKEHGFRIGGFNAYITSDVLNGAGMSSSAVFEVLVGHIFSGEYNDMAIDAVLVAQIGQYAENVYFGKPCGLMDQTASSVGSLITIDFKDNSNPVVKKIDVDFEAFGYSLCLVDTKGSHADLTPDYAAIPAELKKVCAYFGESFLRDVDEVAFYANIEALRDVAGDRGVLRAIHVFEENKRVDGQIEALESGDFDAFLKLVEKSGDSSYKYLQNVFTCNDPQNQAVSLGLAVSQLALCGKGVVRVHGGGFAGTIQAFVPNDFVEEYKTKIEAVFGEGSCHVLKVRKYGGIKVL